MSGTKERGGGERGGLGGIGRERKREGERRVREDRFCSSRDCQVLQNTDCYGQR